MLSLIVAAVSVVAGFWIYLDATKHHIGKDPTVRSFWGLSAGGWATWGLCFWPLGVPVYLIRRPSLLERAKKHPVDPSSKTRSLVFLGVASATLLLINLSNYTQGSVPSCDSEDVTSLAKRIIAQQGGMSVSAINLLYPAEEGYNSHTEVRSCRAVLRAGNEDHRVRYTVQWQSEADQQMWVELTGVD